MASDEVVEGGSDGMFEKWSRSDMLVYTYPA